MARKVNIREEVPSFLVVCEGRETEPLYFRSFHVGYVVHVRVEGLGRDPVHLVREAIRLKWKDDYDQIWVVFDIEDSRPAQVNAAIHLANDHNICVAYSNQAFELWYLLHFGFYQTALDRNQYCQKLTDLLGFEYKKNSPDLYVRLLNQQGDAIRHAKRLYALYEGSVDPCRNDPCTTVFQLVEQLIRYSRDSRRR